MSDIVGVKIKDCKFLLGMVALVCLAFQACAQSDPLGESSRSNTIGSSGDYLNPNMGQMSRDTNPDEGVKGMVQWLDQPVNKDVTKSTTTATSTTPATEPTSTTKSTTTTSTTPGFEATFAVAGLLAVTFIALRRRC
jgi:PGF-CTERM protein